MTDGLTDRLNQILPTITSDAFLRGKGLGNEIAFYIFDYPPEAELRVREHLQFVLEHLPRTRPGLRVCHMHLLDFVLTYLRQQDLLDKAMAMQQTRGDAFILKQLAPLLHPNKIAPVFAEVAQPDQHDLVLVSGVGSVYPLLRVHTLLNNLHAVMGQTPLVLFYPGRYDGQALRLFGKLKHDNYYRAFKLVP
jgi:bacteriophage exclusion system BrxB-like protein